MTDNILFISIDYHLPFACVFSVFTVRAAVLFIYVGTGIPYGRDTPACGTVSGIGGQCERYGDGFACSAGQPDQVYTFCRFRQPSLIEEFAAACEVERDTGRKLIISKQGFFGYKEKIRIVRVIVAYVQILMPRLSGQYAVK